MAVVKVDQRLIPPMIIDDEMLKLLKPANADVLGKIVAETGRVPDAQFEYPHAPAMAEDFMRRRFTIQVEMDTASLKDNPLWQAELGRQEGYGQLALCLAHPDWQRANSVSDRLYGSPDETRFREAMQEVRTGAEQALAAGNDEQIRQVAESLLALLPDTGPVEPTSLPAMETIAALRDWYAPIFEQRVSGVDFDALPKMCEAQEIVSAYEGTLTDTGIRAEVTDEVTAVTFETSKGRLAVPPGRRMSPKQLRANMAHELLHVDRHLNGVECGPLLLAGYGLPGYLTFEEGVATACTTSLSDKEITSYARPEAYLAIGLAAGLSGQPFESDELYQVLLQHYMLEELLSQLKKDQLDPVSARDKGHRQAWTRLVRVKRGTPGCSSEALGLYCSRDLSYRNGNVAVWRWIAEHLGQLRLLLAAKANLDDPWHIEYVSRYAA